MKRSGFTLIELIVVLAIISILLLLGLPKYKEYTKDARLTRIKVQAAELEKASKQYYIRNTDWPRLSTDAYSVEEIKEFGEKILDKTGVVIELESEGNYYDIDYAKISNYITEPKDKNNYILQNPVGNIFYIEGITESAKQRIDSTEKKEELPEGAVTIEAVPLGTVIYDTTWEWVHQGGTTNTPKWVTKPVEWLVVARNHEGYPENTITLMSKDLVVRGRYDSKYKDWKDTDSIRPLLNTTFYNSFSELFKNIIKETNLQYNQYNSSEIHSSLDKVFIPSAKEVGLLAQGYNEVGNQWAYFNGSVSLMANFTDGTKDSYWLRTPRNSKYANSFSMVFNDGTYIPGFATLPHIGVRPVVNIDANTLLKGDDNGGFKIYYKE